jgi:hypothetical protein
MEQERVLERVFVRNGHGTEVHLLDSSLFKLHRYLLILSHARSYTTLLCHILGSHRQISGYGETMLLYETAADLYRLNAKACVARNYRSDCEYVLDKLLYDFLTVSDKVLGLPRVIPIFVVREPEPTIASLTRMRVREYEQGIQEWEEGTDRRAAAGRAAEYYTSRLQTLQAVCARLEAVRGRGIFLPARWLLDDTAGTLRFLEGALNLDGPLREEYKFFENTGKPGYGDTSPRIRSGRVVRDPMVEEDIPIPADLLERARNAYAACMNSLRNSPSLARHGQDVNATSA